ncbi:hypothetical protein A3G14_00285 [Candidatus Curtissbacteria bacterium RIFCSPLOWO2_12_FULL_38_9]|uniref:Pilus assembly protein PilO n=1 Tax=Candidatus Curtissbacteria bacterium RIFCSPLOWO2_12_FULL_38_9 TaxID=1797735 RepID=A0A1F5I8L0_9BACT|nr:MAG: hypothetical protein A3G14_00285 [Candidatus Curtissbacteria bacterium RIFCSPLOWO2_12_FULL_38_9]
MDLSKVKFSKVSEGQDVAKILEIGIPIGGIIISILIAVLIIWPKINEILELKADNEQLAGRATILEQKAEILANLNQSELEDQLAAAELLLPSDNNVFGLLRQIEDSASATGVLLTKIEAVTGTFGSAKTIRAPVSAKSTGGGDSPRVEVRLSLTSEYQSLLEFLARLYSFSRVVSIDSIGITAGREESTQLSTSFSVNAHWRELPQSLGSIEAPVEELTSKEEELLRNVQSPETFVAPTVPSVPTGRGNPFDPY